MASSSFKAGASLPRGLVLSPGSEPLMPGPEVKDGGQHLAGQPFAGHVVENSWSGGTVVTEL